MSTGWPGLMKRSEIKLLSGWIKAVEQMGHYMHNGYSKSVQGWHRQPIDKLIWEINAQLQERSHVSIRINQNSHKLIIISFLEIDNICLCSFSLCWTVSILLRSFCDSWKKSNHMGLEWHEGDESICTFRELSNGPVNREEEKYITWFLDCKTGWKLLKRHGF